MMKMTGLSHLFKWENLHNWWLTKYYFAPLYIYIKCVCCFILLQELLRFMTLYVQLLIMVRTGAYG